MTTAQGGEPFVVIVILNTNRRDDTLRCVLSLSRSTYRRQQILVLDNASRDGSLEAIGTAYPHVVVLPLRENKGYAGNNNIGISWALERGADWVLLLNEDTVVAPECVTRLVSSGESDARIGILGPMVYHMDDPGIIQSAGGVLDRHWSSFHVGQNEPDLGQFGKPRQVDWVSGCALIARRAFIEAGGLLDERFFYYWEETEWCLRASRLGWKIVHEPSAVIWHAGVTRDYRPGPNVTYYDTRNRLLMMAKHRAPPEAWLHVLARTTMTLASWTLRPKWAGRRDHRDAMAEGLRDFVLSRWGPRAR